MQNMTRERKFSAASMFTVGFMNVACAVLTLALAVESTEVWSEANITFQRWPYGWKLYGAAEFTGVIQGPFRLPRGLYATHKVLLSILVTQGKEAGDCG